MWLDDIVNYIMKMIKEKQWVSEKTDKREHPWKYLAISLERLADFSRRPTCWAGITVTHCEAKIKSEENG